MAFVAGPGRQRLPLSGRKLLRWGLVVLVLAVAAFVGWRWWVNAQRYASTDNAYVNTDRADIAAQVGGPVRSLQVRENQRVRRGDPLFDIDPANYQAAVAKADAQLALARQTVSQQSAAVDAARAQVAQREAELANAQSSNRRTARLVSRGFLSPQGGESSRTQAQTAAAALQAARANLQQALSTLGDAQQPNATIQAAEAALQQARLDLGRTRVVSPADGVVTNLSLRPGDVVQPGVPLFVIVSDTHYWVDANFKETELAALRAGRTATIEVDMYPGHVFHGVVDSISGGAGTAFSLLPPQNATGNWVKVTQRVPVRIRVLDPDPAHPLRVGTTATVTVSLRDDRER